MNTPEQVALTCKKKLGERYTTPIASGSKIAIIVPVFNESVEMIRQLVDSLNTQRSVDLNEVAVFLVVNNDRPSSKKLFDHI